MRRGALMRGKARMRGNAWGARWRRAERGSISVELAVLAPGLVLLVAIQHFVRGAAKQIKGTTP